MLIDAFEQMSEKDRTVAHVSVIQIDLDRILLIRCPLTVQMCRMMNLLIG